LIYIFYYPSALLLSTPVVSLPYTSGNTIHPGVNLL